MAPIATCDWTPAQAAPTFLSMERNPEHPDVRFWTTYDHFMFERETRALRRKHVRALMRAWWKRTKARLARELRHAGAQPVKPRVKPV